MMTRWCLPYFGCPLMHRKVLASSRQHLMVEATRSHIIRSPEKHGTVHL